MFNTIFNDLVILFCFLLVGFVLRELIKPLQKLFIPASVLGGLVALIVGPQVLGLVELPESFSSMPSPMIVLVLAAMFMGNTISKSSLSNYAGATNISCLLYYAQVVVGVLLGIVFSGIWSGMPEHWGLLGVFSFFGGHGTAASAGAIFQEAFLSYIGLGIAPPDCSWGILAKESIAVLQMYPFQVVIPAFFICTTMLALNLLGDGLRDAVDPKLRGTE